MREDKVRKKDRKEKAPKDKSQERPKGEEKPAINLEDLTDFERAEYQAFLDHQRRIYDRSAFLLIDINEHRQSYLGDDAEPVVLNEYFDPSFEEFSRGKDLFRLDPVIKQIREASWFPYRWDDEKEEWQEGCLGRKVYPSGVGPWAAHYRYSAAFNRDYLEEWKRLNKDEWDAKVLQWREEKKERDHEEPPESRREREAVVATNAESGTYIFPNLPTEDPMVEGQLWNEDGTLRVSSGG